MGIGDFLSGMRRRSELLRQAQDEDSVVEKVQQRKLTANERLLIRLQEQDRQAAIKNELARREKHERNDFWKKDVITQPNLFNQRNGNSLLRQQSLFGVGGNR